MPPLLGDFTVNDRPPQEASAPPEVHKLRVPMTQYYALQAPEEAQSSSMTLLLALHGFGQNCRRFLRDFVPLRSHPILVAAPQGPDQFYHDTASKKVGFNWLTVYDKATRIADVNNYLATLHDEVKARYPEIAERPFVLGFSQGVSMAWRFATSGRIRPAGLIACCADLAPDVAERLGTLQPFPVLLIHGDKDPVFPLEKLKEAEAILRQHQWPVEVRRFDAGHELTDEMMDALAIWIGERR
jgi:phospholipase/carboxylesterase